MARIKWDASGGNNLNGFQPGDNLFSNDDKSMPTDSDFSGHREYSDVSRSSDYTARTNESPNVEKNPTDKTLKDVDDMANLETRKREFSRREETSNVQKSNTAAWREQSDSDRRPDEDTDPFEPDPEDPNFLVKTRRSKIKGHFGSGQYDNYPNRGTYEGEIS